MLVSNYTHLPLTTTNASSQSLRSDKRRKSPLKKAGKPRELPPRSGLWDDKNSPKDSYYPDFNEDGSFTSRSKMSFGQHLEQAIHQTSHSWSEQRCPSWQRTIAVSMPDELHLTTGKEPTLGLLFYSHPVQARITQWSSSRIPVNIQETSEYSEDQEDLALKYQKRIEHEYHNPAIELEKLTNPKAKVHHKTTSTLRYEERVQASKSQEKVELIMRSKHQMEPKDPEKKEPKNSIDISI